MIVCHCNVILRAEILTVAETLLAADPGAPLEPRHIYRELEKRGRCCGCYPTVMKIIDDFLTAATVAGDEGQRLTVADALSKTISHPSS
ncbi:MAG: hypothetical protein AAF615_00775 [Pseudomonadota bacterium]